MGGCSGCGDTPPPSSPPPVNHPPCGCRSDAYLPVGGALRELRLSDCHLPAAPDMLAALGSLTLLSISMCDGFAEAQGRRSRRGWLKAVICTCRWPLRLPAAPGNLPFPPCFLSVRGAAQPAAGAEQAHQPRAAGARHRAF